MTYAKTVTYGNKDSGVDVTYTKSRKSISLTAHFDSGHGGMGSTEKPLVDFLFEIGVSLKDLQSVIILLRTKELKNEQAKNRTADYD